MFSGNLSDQLLQELGRQIIQGQLLPGSLLPKVEVLSEMKGVSRTVVRETLKGLSARRLVESTTRVGTVVCPRSDWQWWDPDVLTWATETEDSHLFLQKLTEIRLAVEPSAVELAAKNATEQDLLTIQECYRQLERTIDNELEWAKADEDFHKSILAASNNELMHSLIQTLHLALERSRLTTIHLLKEHPEPSYRDTADEVLARHKAITEAICSRDGKKARSKMEELLHRVVEVLGTN